MKYFVMIMAAFLAVGCGDYTGDYVGDTTNTTNTDNSVDNSTDYICRDNADTQCYTPDYSGYIDKDGEFNDVADEPTGEYDASYSPAECAANGFFWCSIEQKCLNIPASGGTCNK